MNCFTECIIGRHHFDGIIFNGYHIVVQLRHSHIAVAPVKIIFACYRIAEHIDRSPVHLTPSGLKSISGFRNRQTGGGIIGDRYAPIFCAAVK